MKLRNKKTGKIEKLVGYVKTGDDRMFFRFEDDIDTYKKEYNSLAELNAEWEDVPEESVEPYWFINDLDGEPMKCDLKNCGKSNFIEWGKHRKEICNYFETKEEAEKAVEKLKAWKRLKDKGFKLNAVVDTFFCLDIFMRGEPYEAIKDDLKIVFGGEE